MPLYFVTGNANKFAEAKHVLPDLEQLDIDLVEIQSLDAKEILESKVNEAFKHTKGEFIIEDVSLYMDCLPGLPGPFIKWFTKSLGLEKVVEIAEKFNNPKAKVAVIYAYAKSPEQIHYFESVVEGEIVRPRGSAGFGWNPIFVATGSTQTFAELQEANSGPNQMRLGALTKLKAFLESSDNK